MPAFLTLRHATPVAFALAGPFAMMLASCSDRTPSPAPTHAVATLAPTQPADQFERDAHSMVGISYPPGLARYPALAQRLVDHARARRALIARALAQTPDPPAPLELSLHFATVADTPELYAVSAEEELYLGGSSSRPASTTFLWLPSAQRMLSPDELIPDPAAWAMIHAYVRQRRQDESAAVRVDDTPTRSMRHDFAPRMNSAGRIAGLRFRTEDGSEVEVPAAMLKPRVSPAYAAWFEGAAAPAATPAG